MAINPSRFPLIGGFFPDTDAQALQEQFARMSQAYNQYRGFNADAAKNRLDSQIISTGPMREMMHRMMPTMQGFDLQTPQRLFNDTAQGAQAISGTTGGMGPAASSSYRIPNDPNAVHNAAKVIQKEGGLKGLFGGILSEIF